MNLLFLSNWERTETWIAAGSVLEGRGHKVFFSVTRNIYKIAAQTAGFSPDRILWLTRQGAMTATIDDAMTRLAALEDRTGERVADIILMDRFLRSEKRDWALRYTAYVFLELERFIASNDIRLGIGQPDNVPDLIATMILKDRGAGYAAPFAMRLPANRFMLWDSKLESRPHITGAPTPADVSPDELAEARQLREHVRGGAKLSRPVPKGHAATRSALWVKRLFRGFLYRALVVSRHDVYMYTLRSVLLDLKYHLVPFNHWRLRRAWATLFEQPIPGERFVFYALHYAPEHTIDVEGAPFVATYETVRNIARSLPLDTKLYVKEHPIGLGIRGPAEMARLKRLPGVRLIDPNVDSHVLIKAAALTVSISGTVALEAALYGRQSAILSDIFIANFSTCRRLTAPWMVGAALREPPRQLDEEADLRYLAWLISNSHEGSVIEPLMDRASLQEPNLTRIADGIEKVILSLPPIRRWVRDQKDIAEDMLP